MKNRNRRWQIRQSVQKDLAELVRLEQTAFSADRFQKDHIEYLLTRARASVFVAECGEQCVGAVYILWRKNISIGRLYNVAVDPKFQNKGIGGALLAESETEAVRRGCRKMILEVRQDNETAILFYQNREYEAHAVTPDFYDDGTPAVRMKKRLSIHVAEKVRNKIPYYAQTLGFSCGPACLMMAMMFFKPSAKHNRILELNLWKEATLIFMTSGIGGTDPYGIALAAARRGFQARVLTSTEKTPFVKSVRIPEKKAVIRLIHADMKREALALGVGSLSCDFTFEDIKSMLLRGWIPVSLISTYRLHGTRDPHWVVVTGFDADYVYIHDPYERGGKQAEVRTRNLRIEHNEFHRMSRYGKDVFRCTVFIGPPVGETPEGE